MQQIPWFVAVNQNWMSNVEDVPTVTDSFIFQGMGHGILAYTCTVLLLHVGYDISTLGLEFGVPKQ